MCKNNIYLGISIIFFISYLLSRKQMQSKNTHTYIYIYTV